MGTKLNTIIKSREIEISDLSGKRLVFDTFNLLYQFLSTIRQQDGSLLTNSKGMVTSHLSGLFFRTTQLMKSNLKLAFVLDGVAPDLKKQEREKRSNRKKEAQRQYDLAVDEGDIELMRKYASRTASLTKEMLDESKELINALGLPLIQAPSEGEAQAAYMVKKGEFFGLISQDTDGLLFGSTNLIKNLSITKKRKRAGSSIYQRVNPEIVNLSENLNELSIDNEQLIVVGMLCGTDFNNGGIKGIGPKKALLLLKKYNKDFNALFKEVLWDNYFDYSWKKVYDTILNMPVTDDYKLNWTSIDSEKVMDLLVKKCEFSEDRITKVLEELSKKQAQKGLSDFF